MRPLRPAAKAGIVLGGLVASFALAYVAVSIRARLNQSPEAQAASGMYAFGDLLMGMAVFGLLALGPLGLTLYWLRPVARFWTLLARAALVLVLTGPLAVLTVGWLRQLLGSWTILATARIGFMPLIAPALLVAGLFAPHSRPRWLFLASAVVEGGIFALVILVKFILPGLLGKITL
jgi:hypothetical protein